MLNKPYRFSLPLEHSTVNLYVSHAMVSDRNRVSKERHCNGDYELHIFLSGVCQVNVEDQSHTIEAPQALLIAPNQYHDFQFESQNIDRLALSFSLSKGILLDTIRHSITSFTVLPMSQELVDLCNRIFSEFDDARSYQHTMIPILISLLATDIFRLLELSTSKQNETLSIQKHRVIMIDEYFSESVTQDWNEEELAKKLHLSKRQLARVLQEHYGMTFRQKRISSRMEHAKYLLRVTDMNIGEIATTEGYRSEAAFYKAFRSHYNMTPHAYRSLKRKLAKGK